MRRTSQHVLKVADKPIDISSSGSLVNDVLVVVVAKSATQLFVVHLRLLLTGAPATSDLIWIAEAELPAVARP